MKSRPVLFALLAVAASTFACSGESGDDVDEGGNAVTTTAKIKPEWKGPAPGSKNNDIDGKLILSAWKKVKETFYDNKGLKGLDQQGNEIPLANYPAATEAPQCTGNAVPWWSDLLMHFYCWQPSYATATPNVRGCFSYVTRGLQGPPPVAGQPPQAGFEQRMLFYPEVYDYCLFQPYDYARSSMTGKPNPIFDTDEIDKNKTAGNKVGVMKWVDDNIGDAFKHIMFTWYEPETYNAAQQQEIINAFYDIDLQGKLSYGPGDAAQVKECNAKRRPQALDPRDGTHCSNTKKLQGAAPNQNAAAAIQYMTNHVKTLPYTKSSVGGGTSQPPPSGGGGGPLVSRQTDKCVDVAQSSNADGALVQQWPCKGTTSQTWRFEDTGAGKFQIIAKHSGKCIEAVGQSTADNSPMQQSACNKSPSQLWTLADAGGGYVRIANVASTKCLNLPGGATADGTGIGQRRCSTTPNKNQEWKR